MKNLFKKNKIPYCNTEDLAKFIFDDLIFHYTGRKYYNHTAYINSIKKIYRNPKTGETLKDLKKETPFVYTRVA